MDLKEYIKLALRTEARGEEPWKRFVGLERPQGHTSVADRNMRVFHAILGLQSELGELVDAYKKFFFYGKLPKNGNLLEEMGDLFWYLAILMDAEGLDPSDVLERNIAKLRVRYPEKFEESQATKRDLCAEEGVLTGCGWSVLGGGLCVLTRGHDGPCRDSL